MYFEMIIDDLNVFLEISFSNLEKRKIKKNNYIFFKNPHLIPSLQKQNKIICQKFFILICSPLL